MGELTFAVVTTCNDRHWSLYGQRMVESFARHWPAEVPFYLYAEGFVPGHPRVKLHLLPPWLAAFKQRHADDLKAHGRGRGGYDFRTDCVRFSHKVAAVTDAALATSADVLIWLDADTVTHADVTPSWLKTFFDPRCYIAWLDRMGQYPEAGFYMLNCRHPQHLNMMAEFRDLYASDRVFSLPETHDAFVMQYLMETAEREGRIAIHSLSGPKGRKCAHPLPNTRLAECLDHLKGNRKQEGRSRRSDLQVARAEPYWRG